MKEMGWDGCPRVIFIHLSRLAFLSLFPPRGNQAGRQAAISGVRNVANVFASARPPRVPSFVCMCLCVSEGPGVVGLPFVAGRAGTGALVAHFVWSARACARVYE